MNFGDLIAYSRGLYKHYAVYTGKNEKGQDTVVEFTGESGLHSKAGATVKQGLLKPDGKVVNYDEIMGLKPQPVDKMEKAVQQLLKDGGGKYGVLDNNCEHLATFVRYGKPVSLQAEAVLNTQTSFNNQLAENMGASFLPPIYKKT
ncbi:phospholipase A and acyltransferase 1-like isoform X2 [Paramisgurnus dabryanus]